MSWFYTEYRGHDDYEDENEIIIDKCKDLFFQTENMIDVFLDALYSEIESKAGFLRFIEKEFEKFKDNNYWKLQAAYNED